MAATTRALQGTVGRERMSPGPHTRDHAKDTLCRNVTIYGRCRYEDKGCAFNHDPSRLQAAQAQAQTDGTKKRLNVDSPTFTPSSLPSNGAAKPFRPQAMSPEAANAAPFRPMKLNQGNVGALPLHDVTNSNWPAPDAPEFITQTFDNLSLSDGTGAMSATNLYDPYGTSTNTLAEIGAGTAQPQVNPYAPDTTGISSGGAGYYQGQGNFAQPLQYHLYAPLGPHRENLLPYQRSVHNLFIPDGLREELQRKSEASLQVLPNSNLPSTLDHFHSLVPLDTTNQKNTTIFGYPSWVYKAVSGKDGKLYALRRLEGYRLTNEKSIRIVQGWKRVDNATVVSIHDAFTTSGFGDRSLVFVTDYHPLSKTLMEHCFSPSSRFSGRTSSTHIPEQILWSYIVQIATALHTIHGLGLAARVIDLSKVLLTSTSRIRLNGCAVLDVIQHDIQTNVSDLQLVDFVQFGRLMLALASNNPGAAHQMQKSMDHLSRSYSADFKDCVIWLLSPDQQDSSQPKTIDQFLRAIAGQVASFFNNALHLDDHLQSELARELENGRLVRLMAKLNTINERPEFDHDRQWSETGDRYLLKLFRDYVFHQVDAENRPVVNLGHILSCLNQLDAGVDEKIILVSRDDQNCLLVSYRELKRAVETSFQDLIRAGRSSNSAVTNAATVVTNAATAAAAAAAAAVGAGAVGTAILPSHAGGHSLPH